jgi:hypothetical protein
MEVLIKNQLLQLVHFRTKNKPTERENRINRLEAGIIDNGVKRGN